MLKISYARLQCVENTCKYSKNENGTKAMNLTVVFETALYCLCTENRCYFVGNIHRLQTYINIH